MSGLASAIRLLQADAPDDDATQQLAEKQQWLKKIRAQRRVKQAKREKHAERNMLKHREHLIPDAATNAAKERILHRIATKGVVTLFNAVAEHQRSQEKVEEEAKSSNKRTKLNAESKSQFLERLKTGANTSVETSSWSVLEDDFVHQLGEDAGSDFDE